MVRFLGSRATGGGDLRLVVLSDLALHARQINEVELAQKQLARHVIVVGDAYLTPLNVHREYRMTPKNCKNISKNSHQILLQ